MKTIVSISIMFISGCIGHVSILDPVVENVVHLQASHPPTGVPGIWKKKTLWKARWVKEWKSATVVKPVWKKIWSPVEIREWVPIPKPPPNWNGTVEESIPPWTPIPYPDPPPEPYRTIFETSTPLPGEEDLLHGKPAEPDEGYNYSTPPPSQEFQELPETATVRNENSTWRPTYKVGSSDPETLQATGTNHFPPHPNGLPMLSEFLEPPKIQFRNENWFQRNSESTKFDNSLSNSTKLLPTAEEANSVRPYQKELSPYAVKLAQAIIQEKFNRSKNVTGKPLGLTEVIFKKDSVASSTDASLVNGTSTKVSLQSTLTASADSESTTEYQPRVFIVTPISRPS